MWGCPPQQSSPFSWPGEGGQGDEVDQVADSTLESWKSPLHRRLRSRLATRPFQFTPTQERITLKSELLPRSPSKFGSVVDCQLTRKLLNQVTTQLTLLTSLDSVTTLELTGRKGNARIRTTEQGEWFG